MILCLLCGSVAASGQVRHSLSFPADREQIILVRSEFPVAEPVTVLSMPNWTPGSYLIRDFAANVEGISASSPDGSVLKIHKISKDRWQVDTAQVEKLIIEYQVFTPKMAVQLSWASRDYSLVNGASVFLYSEHTKSSPQLLEMIVNADRGEVFTAMPSPQNDGVLLAGNYDELIDNPVVVAKAPVYQFSIEGQDYKFVNVGENSSWDGAEATGDVEKIVAATQLFWGVNPLQRPYWFLNFAIGGRGGLEHDHSTVMIADRRPMRDRDAYISWLGIVAHEFFHVWNVRNMRPVALGQYDYQNEQYTSQLWIAEGLTSYFDNLILARAGLIKLEEYLALLANNIHRLETTPGRLVRPVTEASFDTWIRHYTPGSNTLNSTISYYTKGAVIGFVLDAYIRKTSKDKQSLDNVMQKMYQMYSDRPYGSDAFDRILVDVGGKGASELLQSMLTTTAELDVDTALDWYGLRLERSEAVLADDAKADPPRSGIGVIWDQEKPVLTIKSVLAESAAAKAGLMAGDEMIAIDDERLSADNLDGLLGRFLAGEETTVLVARRGQILKRQITLDTAIPERFNIVVSDDFSKRHITRLQKLLGQKGGQ